MGTERRRSFAHAASAGFCLLAPGREALPYDGLSEHPARIRRIAASRQSPVLRRPRIG
jgi:hypothetical protein